MGSGGVVNVIGSWMRRREIAMGGELSWFEARFVFGFDSCSLELIADCAL